MCQHCQTLQHECYSLTDTVCGQCQWDKKTCQDVIVKGEPFSLDINFPSTETVVVDPVPAAHCWVHLTVAPTKSATQPKKVTAKGKAVSQMVTQPQASKIMQVTSPSPGVAEVTGPTPPVTWPSWTTCPPLFKEPAMSGAEDIGKVAPATSSKWYLTLLP